MMQNMTVYLLSHYSGSLDIDETTRQSQGSDSGSGNINEDSNFSFVGDMKNSNEDSNDTSMSAGNTRIIISAGNTSMSASNTGMIAGNTSLSAGNTSISAPT